MEANSAKISVVIPTWNEEKDLPRALASLRAADEVVVADGGSHDRTVELARQQGCVVVNAPLGRGVQLCAGASTATGDIFLFLHADNWLADDAIQQLRQHAGTRQSKRIFGAFRQHIDDPRWRFRWLEWGNAMRAKQWQTPYGDQAIFIDRQTYNEIGGVPPVALMEDVILARAARKLCRPRLLLGPVFVDPRRWLRDGVVFRTLRNWSILTAYFCGVPIAKLTAWYG